MNAVEKCITFEADIQAPAVMSDFFTDIAQLSFKTRLEELKDYAHASFDIQNEQLFNLLNEAQGCFYGKKYDFRNIFSYQDFRERLPILQNSDIQPYLRKMIAGKPNILWPGICKHFVKAPQNGSQKNGNNKHCLPVSDQMISENFFQGINDCNALYLKDHPESRLFSAFSIWLGVDSKEENLGNISAVLRKNMPFILSLLTFPNELPEESANEQLTEEILKKCQQDKISNFQGTPSLFKAFMDKAYAFFGKKSIQEICPSAEAFFHRGCPVPAQMEQGIEGLNYQASYCSAEGFFGIQDQPGETALLLMLDTSVFYEFIPVDAALEPQNAVPLEEVVLGKDYRMIITTCSGLWRYCSEGPAIRFVAEKPYKFILCNN